MINTLKLSNLLFNKILIGEHFLNYIFDNILLSFKFNEQFMGHSNNTHPLTQNTKKS